MPVFDKLTISNLDDFIFGSSPHPVTLKNGLSIGAGQVFPELNFTLPGMSITAESMPDVRRQYTQMVEEACQRAVELHTPGLVVEFELLPDLTLQPEWGASITRLLRDALDRFQQKFGLPVGLRVTPNDVREYIRPPLLRQGEMLETMQRSLELCAAAGADMLSIESTGGKEVHDEAVLATDLHLAVFALGILASRDMAFLWERITQICGQAGVIPAGDSACGFANTAMVLAEQRFIPRVWSAVIRVMSVARSLIAFEQGAVGPGKDCAYEGPYIKAITGYPTAAIGAEAAIGLLSPIGNITKAVPDLWSNDSVQNVKLLGGMAPTVSLEQLVYASRLFNAATARGRQHALALRDLFVESDAWLDPQAYILRPDIILHLAGQIIAETTPYRRTRRAALATLACLRRAQATGDLSLSRPEMRWLDALSRQADSLPEDEAEFVARTSPRVSAQKVRLEEYELVFA